MRRRKKEREKGEGGGGGGGGGGIRGANEFLLDRRERGMSYEGGRRMASRDIEQLWP